MPSNPKGYGKNYYQKERRAIIEKLGGKCNGCGGEDKLEIHHIRPILKGGNRGREARLVEWKRNMDNLQILCHDCHKDWHKKNGVEYMERIKREEKIKELQKQNDVEDAKLEWEFLVEFANKYIKVETPWGVEYIYLTQIGIASDKIFVTGWIISNTINKKTITICDNDTQERFSIWLYLTQYKPIEITREEFMKELPTWEKI